MSTLQQMMMNEDVVSVAEGIVERASKHRTRLTQADHEHRIRRWMAGGTVMEIAGDLGISRQALARWAFAMRQHGVALPKLRRKQYAQRRSGVDYGKLAYLTDVLGK